MSIYQGYWPLPRKIRCQHCRRDLHQVAGVPDGRHMYADREGFVLCIQPTGTVPAAESDYVYHTPMPEVR